MDIVNFERNNACLKSANIQFYPNRIQEQVFEKLSVYCELYKNLLFITKQNNPGLMSTKIRNNKH